MKKLPLFIIACLLVSVTTWAEWTQPTLALKTIVTKGTPTISCSADGKIIYLAVNDNGGTAFGDIHLYRSTNGGETWAEQIFAK